MILDPFGVRGPGRRRKEAAGRRLKLGGRRLETGDRKGAPHSGTEAHIAGVAGFGRLMTGWQDVAGDEELGRVGTSYGCFLGGGRVQVRGQVRICQAKLYDDGEVDLM